MTVELGSLKRTFKIEDIDEEGVVQASTTFKFPFREETDFEAMKKFIGTKKDEAEEETDGPNWGIARFKYTTIRKSIVEISGFTVGGEPVKLHKEDGSIDENIQKMVFEWWSQNKDYMQRIANAYNGETEKNLEAGVMQSTPDGD